MMSLEEMEDRINALETESNHLKLMFVPFEATLTEQSKALEAMKDLLGDIKELVRRFVTTKN